MGRYDEYEYEVTQSRVHKDGIGVKRPELGRIDEPVWDLVSTTFGVVDGQNYIFFTWRRKYAEPDNYPLSEEEYLDE